MKKKSKGVLIIAVLVIPMIWLTNWILVKTYYASSTENQGLFGDMFGASTSLFSGISLALLIYTILLQKEELADNREEFKKQNRTLSYQRFDNTFFNMVDLHGRIINGHPWEGMPFAHYISTHINRLEPHRDVETLKESFKTVSLSYTTQYFGQYIGNFENTVNFILRRKKKSKSQDSYLRIYFAQLTINEKIFLLYYYNLTYKPAFWTRCKEILFEGMQANHLYQPNHAFILDGIRDPLSNIK